ncbi:VOC family protein [Archangium violaceum]|uniref:VOC family protein n=1 Tax=Archangium violaceum TaxID=83451 RepID=UPI00193B0691|nr:VOC family protein [Archangium violaceum]QRK07506.1 VOC family protein [Archangium violaceum]
MNARVGHLHHVGLVVDDLDQATALYQRLGFRLQPPAYPVMSLQEDEPPKPFGAANTHIEFPRNFVELVALLGDDRPIPGNATPVPLQVPPAVRPRVLETIKRTVATISACRSRFEGLHILVFQTPDAEATGEQLRAEGVRHSGVNTVQRQLDTEDGPKRVPIRLLEMDDETVPEGRLAIAENPPSEILHAQRHLEHPNGALDLVESVLCVADTEVEDFERRYSRYLARPARRDGPARVFDLDDARVSILSNSGLATALPGEQAPALPAFVAYAVAVRDLEATRALLHGNGFPVMTTAGGDTFVPATAALGAAIIFREHSKRGVT